MKTTQILAILKILSWVLFIGLCIQAGSQIVSFLIFLLASPEAAANISLAEDLTPLFEYSEHYYIYIVSLQIAIGVLKAYLFYLVIKLLEKIKLDKPFSLSVSRLISKLSYFALVSAVIAAYAKGFSKWLLKKGADFQIDWGSSELLLMAGILFIFGYIFKRGVEIQEENNLTI